MTAANREFGKEFNLVSFKLLAKLPNSSLHQIFTLYEMISAWSLMKKELDLMKHSNDLPLL